MAKQSAFTARNTKHPWYIKRGSSQQAVAHSAGNEIALPENTAALVNYMNQHNVIIN